MARMPARTPLNYRTAGGSTIGQLVFAPLDAAGVSPLVVDAGARNGMGLLPQPYAGRATLIGFEPNPVEHAKLVQGASDAQRYFESLGFDPPRFKRERYHDCALWDREEVRPLYMTRSAGACTLMGETLPLMRNTYYRYPAGDPRRERSFHDLHSEVVKTVDVQCRALDQLIGDEEVVDFLKIDVEGAELRVLGGAERLFEHGRVLFVQSEFQVFGYYHDHPLFGDQHRFLSERGLRLIDINFDHPRYRRGAVDISDACDRGMLIAGDALYVLDPDRMRIDSLDLHRIAAVVMVFGFTSLAFDLLREAGLLDSRDLATIEATLRDTPLAGWKRRLAQRWGRFPYVVYHAIEAFRARARRMARW